MVGRLEVVLADVIAADDFVIALGTFLDVFKNRNAAERIKMMSDAPTFNEAQREELCVLAGVAHKLANDYGLPIPSWVHKASYTMPSPVFAHGTKNEEYREFLRQDTPYEFASRNIFCGANAIERV